MRQFDYREKWKKLLTPEIVSYLTQIHEFKGEQTLFIEAKADTLHSLLKLQDFGNGFYCTVIKEQAQRWAKRYNTKIVSIYDVKFSSSLEIKEFKEMTDEWLDFIVDCRSGKPHMYDVVIGVMADDQIYNYISDYVEGIITREQFWTLAKFKYPTHQINFCTNAALKCLEYRGYEEVEK